MKTLVGLIPDDEHAALAGTALKTAGFAEDNVHILRRPAEVWTQLEGKKKMRVVLKDALIGMLLGLAVGALYGVVAGVMNCNRMTCSVTTSLIFLVLITLYWIVGGGVLGALIGLDGLEMALYSYVEGVRRGATLFVVETPEKQAPEVAGILKREAGSLIHAIGREAARGGN